MKWKKSPEKKTVWFFALIFAMIPASLLSGCSDYEITMEPEDIWESAASTQQDDLFQSDGTMIYSSISHGLLDPDIGTDGERAALEYDGGELVVKYRVAAEGIAKNVGFLLFLEGSPQPYRLEPDGPEAYMHIFTLEEDNEPYPFDFYINPVKGSQGDTMNLTVASIYNPDFQPDMEKTSSYGMYHDILPFTCRLHFNADAPGGETAVPVYEGALRGASDMQKLTDEFLKEELPANGYGSEVTTDQVDQQLYQSILYDGRIVFDNLGARPGETIPITYKLCGPPGSEYKTTFYLNHMPLSTEDGLSFHTTLSKGDMQVIEAELDMELREDRNTFYAITVPVNVSDGQVLKTPSILFYKEK